MLFPQCPRMNVGTPASEFFRVQRGCCPKSEVAFSERLPFLKGYSTDGNAGGTGIRLNID
jgi:hypothetical protein